MRQLHVQPKTKSQQHKLYFTEGSAETIALAATQRQKLQIKLAISSSHDVDTGLTSPDSDPVTPGAWQGNRTR